MNLLSRDDFEIRHPLRIPCATTLPFDQCAVLKSGLSVGSDLVFRGVISGDVTVKSGVQFSFQGVIKGSLTVEPGATVYLNGVVKRNLYLEGGALLIGVVRGDVRFKGSGTLHVSGVVKGRVLE